MRSNTSEVERLMLRQNGSKIYTKKQLKLTNNISVCFGLHTNKNDRTYRFCHLFIFY
jgi:hypothetical protein